MRTVAIGFCGKDGRLKVGLRGSKLWQGLENCCGFGFVPELGDNVLHLKNNRERFRPNGHRYATVEPHLQSVAAHRLHLSLLLYRSHS